MQNLSYENEFYLHNKKSFPQERFCTWPRFKTAASRKWPIKLRVTQRMEPKNDHFVIIVEIFLIFAQIIQSEAEHSSSEK